MLGFCRSQKKWLGTCRALGEVKLELVQNKKQTILILCLLVVSWWGPLDSLATLVNDQSIKNAAIIYGVARSINSVISLLQSAQISAIVGSINPGELLDPINDLIERFSSVMAWSLSSLVLQKILISVFSSYSFKVIFSFFCLIALVSNAFVKSKASVKRLWTLFLIIVSLRFSVAIICAFTALVDMSFIQDIEKTSMKAVETFNTDISVGVNDITAADEDLEQQVVKLSAEKKEISKQIDLLTSELNALNDEYEKAPKRSFTEKLRLKDKSDIIKNIEASISNTTSKIEELQNRNAQVDELISCSEIQKTGQSCDSSFTKIKNMFDPAKIRDITKKISQTIDDLIIVLVTLVLTTILLPILFLYVTHRIFVALLNAFLKNLEKGEEPAQTDFT